MVFSICMMILKVFSSWRMVPQCIVLTHPNNGKKLIRLGRLHGLQLTGFESIENVWMILKDFVQKETRPNNKDELIKSIERAWKAISMETLEILLASMPYRMKAVINAGGGSTRW